MKRGFKQDSLFFDWSWSQRIVSRTVVCDQCTWCPWCVPQYNQYSPSVGHAQVVQCLLISTHKVYLFNSISFNIGSAVHECVQKIHIVSKLKPNSNSAYSSWSTHLVSTTRAKVELYDSIIQTKMIIQLKWYSALRSGSCACIRLQTHYTVHIVLHHVIRRARGIALLKVGRRHNACTSFMLFNSLKLVWRLAQLLLCKQRKWSWQWWIREYFTGNLRCDFFLFHYCLCGFMNSSIALVFFHFLYILTDMFTRFGK